MTALAGFLLLLARVRFGVSASATLVLLAPGLAAWAWGLVAWLLTPLTPPPLTWIQGFFKCFRLLALVSLAPDAIDL